MEDPTLYHGTYDTSEFGGGSHADVTKITDTNFKELGRNPAGIADWEEKFAILQDLRREAYRAEHAEE